MLFRSPAMDDMDLGGMALHPHEDHAADMTSWGAWDSHAEKAEETFEEDGGAGWC